MQEAYFYKSSIPENEIIRPYLYETINGLGGDHKVNNLNLFCGFIISVSFKLKRKFDIGQVNMFSQVKQCHEIKKESS